MVANDNDADVDVLEILHNQIMRYATLWAKCEPESSFWPKVAIESIHNWCEVAMVLGVPGDLITEGFWEYLALLEG